MRTLAAGALCALLVSPLIAADVKNFQADRPHDCEPCGVWNAPREPFKVWGDTWFVGVHGLSSILITSSQGHVLIDGGLPQSAPLIAANIEKLGFKLADVKLILNSHTHYDHAGGIAALQRASGASVAASPAAKRALEHGGPTADDPQFSFGHAHNDFPIVSGVRAVHDGETLRVGPIAVTAHFTPGHTPGGTSWTWLSCDLDNCMTVAYLDSLNSISAPGFRFTGDATHRSLVRTFEKSIATVAAFDCAIPLAPHPELVDLDGKLADPARMATHNPLFDRKGCAAYAAAARERLEKRVIEERASASKVP